MHFGTRIPINDTKQIFLSIRISLRHFLILFHVLENIRGTRLFIHLSFKFFNPSTRFNVLVEIFVFSKREKGLI